MHPSHKSSHIPLSIAARKLRLSYNAALRLVMTGRIDGDKFEGHWYVTRDAMELAAAHAVAPDHKGEPGNGAR